MLNSITLSLEMRPVEALEEIATEKSQWIMVTNAKQYSPHWDQIRVWIEKDWSGKPQLHWSTNSSDVGYTRRGTPPYHTHFIILPQITLGS